MNLPSTNPNRLHRSIEPDLNSQLTGICITLLRRHHPVDWENSKHSLAQLEPRLGRRAVLAATVQAPQGPLLVYCLHLEVITELRPPHTN